MTREFYGFATAGGDQVFVDPSGNPVKKQVVLLGNVADLLTSQG